MFFFFLLFCVFLFSLAYYYTWQIHTRARTHIRNVYNVATCFFRLIRMIERSDYRYKRTQRVTRQLRFISFFFFFFYFSLSLSFFVPATKRARLTRIKVFSLRRSINRIRFRRSPSRKKGSIFISAARSIAARKPIAFSISRNNYDTERINSSTSRLLHARNIVFSF